MRFVAVVLSVVLTYPALGQEDPVHAIADAVWISGRWYGEYGDTVIEEIWTHPEGSNMTGMFRFIANGTPSFLEFMTLESSEDGVLLRIKHFNGDLTGWEEKDQSETFRLSEGSGSVLVFRHTRENKTLTYTHLPGDSLSIVLAEDREGTPARSEFRFGR